MPQPAKRERAAQSSRGKSAPEPAQAKEQEQEQQEPTDISAELSYREAQAALELCLAQLQATDLDIEAMAGLYERAQSFANRCETLLEQVEQDVMQWDPEQPEAAPKPYQP
ncbi:MAG: exodeoxyribonuclease VII small subunit [Cyanobacteria bacterium]|nr:exodeoxyribonuclease VII small subunit [Cyanobacteriota bacterium]